MIVMAIFVAEVRAKVSNSLISYELPMFVNADLTIGEFSRRQLDCWTDPRSCFHAIRRRHGND
jgi:hypothetical protein